MASWQSGRSASAIGADGFALAYSTSRRFVTQASPAARMQAARPFASVPPVQGPAGRMVETAGHRIPRTVGSTFAAALAIFDDVAASGHVPETLPWSTPSRHPCMSFSLVLA